MNETEILEATAQTQRKIETLLNELETKIGRPALRLNLDRIEVTTLGDDARRELRSVRIQVSPPPGMIGK